MEELHSWSSGSYYRLRGAGLKGYLVLRVVEKLRVFVDVADDFDVCEYEKGHPVSGMPFLSQPAERYDIPSGNGMHLASQLAFDGSRPVTAKGSLTTTAAARRICADTATALIRARRPVSPSAGTEESVPAAGQSGFSTPIILLSPGLRQRWQEMRSIRATRCRRGSRDAEDRGRQALK